MKPVQISTPNKKRGVNLAVDIKNKEICLVKGIGPDAVFLGVIRDGDERFEKLPPIWQMYCRVAWEKMGIL